ncbi:hypothetical protein CVT24_009052 [Panaeolus cyanescens]|uniref:Helicase C-terminal domain-containing protein n=1 Tax=Panaeolus cyanescens TaxID=181874 RepID=A0A409WEP1_9AGAR|nr:hypothetical protein CVT24_009052 [Panaeolus cyanescens]
MLYADSVAKGPEIIDYLSSLLPPHLRNSGLIRPFSVGFHLEYRSTVIDLFKPKKVRVLVCTDAAGMWKLPQTLSSFVQRAGRAARNSKMNGLAVLLAERTIYGVDKDTPIDGLTSVKKANAGRKKGTYGHGKSISPTDSSTKNTNKDPRTKKEISEFAIANGVLRGYYGGKWKKRTRLSEVEGRWSLIQVQAEEGLRSLVQTTKCRRLVTTKAYRNITSGINSPTNTPSVCCDICNPVLLNRTRPGHRFLKHMHGPSALLPESLILSLSSMGPVTEEGLKRALANQCQWIFYSRYRDKLLTVIQNIPAAAYLTVDSTQPTQKKTNKRKAQDISTGSAVKVVDKQNGKHDEVVDAGGCQPSISSPSMPITPATPRATPMSTYPSTPMSRTGSFFSTTTTTPYGGSTPTQTSSSPAVIYPGQYYESGYFRATYPVYSMGRQTSDNSQPSSSSSSSTNPVLRDEGDMGSER